MVVSFALVEHIARLFFAVKIKNPCQCECEHFHETDMLAVPCNCLSPRSMNSSCGPPPLVM